MVEPPPLTAEQFATIALHLLAGKYFQLGAFVMLIYDHALTFGQEYERIWKRRVSGATILFLINRYITPLQFIIIIHAFHDPQWTPETCKRFVAFEGASTVGLIAVCQLIMILRVYALYAQNKWVLSLLLVLWAGQIIVSSVGLRVGFPTPLPPGLVGCIFTGTSELFPAVWVTPLITDTVIFLLTVIRTRDYSNLISRTPTLHVFVRDGIAYFFIIFVANLANTIIYFTATASLKAIGASFSQLITAAMVSRLVLNLRSLSSGEDFNSYLHDSFQGPITQDKAFITRTMHDLGERVNLANFLELESRKTIAPVVPLEEMPVLQARAVLSK